MTTLLLDTPISSVMCADMLPLAKAESPIGSYADKDRVNHLYDYPNLRGMHSFVHSVHKLVAVRMILRDWWEYRMLRPSVRFGVKEKTSLG